MRFFQGGRPAVIWNPSKKRPLVEFKKGVFDTEDEEIIKVLKSKGYVTQQQQDQLVDMQQQQTSGVAYETATRNLEATGQAATPDIKVGAESEEEEVAGTPASKAAPKRALKRPRKK